jgi:hypothetical protein
MAHGLSQLAPARGAGRAPRSRPTARLEAKLQPARVRATLAFAGLFQVTHEMLKSMVLDDVKCFYGYISIGNGAWLPKSGEHESPQSPGSGPGQAVP